MKPRWLFCILILLMASCVNTGERDLPVIQTETVPTEAVPTVVEVTQELIPSATVPSPSPTMAETSTPAPTETQTLISIPAPIIARAAGGPNSFLLVGGSQNGSWVSPADVADDLVINSVYQLYTAFDFQGSIPGQEVAYEPICDQHYITLNPFSGSESAVGVSGDWPVLPRIPMELSTDLEVYLRAITAWQIEQAPSMPIPVIDKIWKVDVEGNGTDEVFINGTRFAEPTGHNVEPRDYSVVLMRTVIGSDVVTVQLVGDYYSETIENQFPWTYNLEFIGDLNADGKMEVVVGLSRWEGTGVMVFEIDGEEVQLVLSVMCSQ